MGCNPGIVYMTISLLLFAVALVLHFHSAHLSLPISDFVTILTAILPIFSFINAFVYPNLLREFSSPNILQRLSPILLQGFQVIYTAVLATLFAEAIVPSAVLDSVLEEEWMAMYEARDGLSIGYIQETLQCCGLKTIDDRAFPFPGDSAGTCAQITGRILACGGPWELALQRHSAIGLVVVILVGVMQIFGLLMMREGTSWWTTMRDDDWEDVSRPLLAAANAEEGSMQQQQWTYGTVNNEGSPRPPRADPTIDEDDAAALSPVHVH